MANAAMSCSRTLSAVSLFQRCHLPVARASHQQFGITFGSSLRTFRMCPTTHRFAGNNTDNTNTNNFTPCSSVNQHSFYTTSSQRKDGTNTKKITTSPIATKLTTGEGSTWKTIKNVAMVTGVTGVVGGFGYSAYKISVYVGGISAVAGMYWGAYVGGALSALVTVGGATVIRRYLSIHPEILYKKVLNEIKVDPVIAEYLGSHIQPGKFKAYANSGGLIFKSHKERASLKEMLSFEKYGLQLMFNLNGDIDSGVVSAHAVQSLSGGYHLKNLAIDFLSGDRLVLIGDVDAVVYKGIVKLR